MKMKLLLVLLSIIFMPSSILAQKKSKSTCEYIKNEIDPFTKKIEARTEPYYLVFKKDINLNTYGPSRAIINVVGVNEENQNQLLFNMYFWNAGTENFTGIYLLLQNDQVVDLNTRKHANIEFESDWSISWQFYDIPDSAWLMLKLNPIKTMRIYLSSATSVDVQIMEENQNAIMKAVSCIDELNIPKPEAPNIIKETSINKDQTNTNPTEKSRFIRYTPEHKEMLFNSWKLSLCTENSVSVKCPEYHMTINRDGSYNFNLDASASSPVKSGTYQIINENFILFIKPDGPPETFEIIQAKENVLELKTGSKTRIFTIHD